MLPLRTHAKFLLFILGTLAVLLALFSWIMIRREMRDLTRRNASQELLLAPLIAADLRDSVLSGRPHDTGNLIVLLRNAFGLDRLEVLRQDGTPAFGIAGPRAELPQLDRIFRTGTQADFEEQYPSPVRRSLTPVLNEEGCRRCHRKEGDVLGVILISRFLEDPSTEIRKHTRQFVVIAAGIIGVMGIVVYLAVRKLVLSPLRKLQQGVEAIGKGDLEQHVMIESGDEFQEAANSFNAVAVRLKESQDKVLDRERFAAIGRVVAGVAHEIRNPLFGISAIGQIFERDLKDPAQHELSRALLVETRRLNQLVEELLIYGHPLKLKLEETDLHVLWEEVRDTHRDDLARRNITVKGNFGVQRPLVTGDPHQIRRVITHLLKNAMESMPVGGSIEIAVQIEEKHILFRMRDRGVGIPRDKLDRAFEPFYSTKPKGTGLGLAICRKILQDHGGDITIESEEGKGTTATITIPSRAAGATGAGAG
jgi:signal transduction histidine kinase